MFCHDPECGENDDVDNRRGNEAGFSHESICRDRRNCTRIASRFWANGCARSPRHFPLWLGLVARLILKYDEGVPKIFWNIE
jgi:hypothetical protein